MKKKSIFAVLISAVILMFCFASGANAADETYSYDIFTYSVKNNQAIIESIDTSGLKKIYIPDTIDDYPVAVIDDSVKIKSSEPFELYIPASVYDMIDTSSPDTALSSFSMVSKFVVDEDNEYYADENGVLYDKAKETLLIFPRGSSVKNFTAPDTLKTIHCRSMSKCKNLETVTLNDGIIKIDNYAFYGCTNLKKINFPEGLETIGQNAFIQCSALESVTLPSSLNSLQNSSFSECTSLKEIIIPDGITELEIFFAADDTALERVVIPDSLNQVDYGAFYDCPALKHIYYKGSEEQWNGIRLNDEEGFTEDISNAVIHYDYTPSSKFDSLTFDIQNGIMTVTGSDVIPDTLPENLFFFEEEKDTVTTIVLDGFRYIGAYAFDNYPALANLIVTGSDIIIADNAFSGDIKLTNCFFFESVSIGKDSFDNCSSRIQIFSEKSKNLNIEENHECFYPVSFEYADSTLSFDGDVTFNRYTFFDSIAVFCGEYDDIEKLRFTSFSFSDIELLYYEDDNSEGVPFDSNTLVNGEITVKIREYGKDVQISFNRLIDELEDDSINDFSLVATDENHKKVPETSFSVFREGLVKALKWMIGIMNRLFKIIGKK